eukprot:3635103-Pleurochrysis_carterae.AAC.3
MSSVRSALRCETADRRSARRSAASSCSSTLCSSAQPKSTAPGGWAGTLSRACCKQHPLACSPHLYLHSQAACPCERSILRRTAACGLLLCMEFSRGSGAQRRNLDEHLQCFNHAAHALSH